MCGITIALGSTKEPFTKQMLNLIRHRGPDDYGVFENNYVSLGHVRLSIIDITGGKQPIFNEDKSKCIVFNGEIYNYEFLKSQLKNTHKFSTRADTEIILHLYEEEGIKCIDKLDGMFAFAIYDIVRNYIFIARDRLGIKPLYYGKKASTLYFASEMKALLFCGDIATFPPGHYYTSEDNFTKYYDLPSYTSINGDVASIVKNIQILLTKAIEKRLVSDVPVGVFLSGGLDSSVVAAVMSQRNHDLYSFSVGMEDSEDLKYAREAAGYLNTNHYEYIYTEEEMLNVLPNVIYHLESFDAPLVRSAVPCYFVSRLAKKNDIKVVLTGEGSDELFSGYHYLKNFKNDRKLFEEILRITYTLHNTNLQRVDRLTMANSVEARVPFLDIDFLSYVLKLPVHLKYSSEKRPEKWLLREAFKNFLPQSVIFRPKQKFSAGAGSMDIIKNIAEASISNEEFEREKYVTNKYILRTKEELYYYRIFKKSYSDSSILSCVGTTKVF